MTSEAKEQPLDFARVEALRRHMLLTTNDMASILGVSRVTYYNWVKGKALRKNNDEQVRKTLRKLLSVIRDHGWPTPDVLGMEQPQRKARLEEILQDLE